MTLKEFKKEMMKNPEFKREYERFDLVFEVQQFLFEARIHLMFRLATLRDKRWMPGFMVRLIDYIRYF